MTGPRVTSMGVNLGDDPDEVFVSRGSNSSGDFAVLIVGPLSFSATFANPEVLRRLAAAATELAEIREQQLAGELAGIGGRS